MTYFSRKMGQDIMGSTALFDLVQDPVFLFEDDRGSFRTIYANPPALALLPGQELIGSRIEELLLPEQSRKALQYLHSAQSSQHSLAFIDTLKLPAGEYTGETTLQPLVTEDGQCHYVLATVKEMTSNSSELFPANMELHKLDSLFSHNADALFEVDMQQVIVRANKAASRVTQQSEAQLLGHSFLSLVDGRFREQAQSHIDQVLSGRAVEFEMAIESGEEPVVVLTNLTPIVIDHSVTGFYALAKIIAEQKQTEQRLQHDVQRYKSLFDNHPHGLFTFDQTGKLESITAATETITGYTLQELQDAALEQLVLPADTEKVRRHFYKTIHHQKSKRFELVFRHKDGQLIDLQAINIPIIVDGKLTGIHSIITDVTEANCAQKTLNETIEMLEIFWENSIDPIFSIDAKGDILKVNPAFEKTFGFTEEEMVTGKGTIIPPDMRFDQNQIVERILNGETVNSHDTLRITKSGEPLNIISSYSLVRDANKQIIGSNIIYKNVTDLKKAERELQKSQEKYRLITESTFDIITLIDLSGSIEYVSPAHEKILGYSGDVHIGGSYTENVHPDDAIRLIDSVTSLINGKEPVTVEVRFVHQDGRYVWMEVSPTPVIAGDEVVQLFTIARDITERRKLQSEIARMAFYDHLSGIPNRRTFDDKLEQAIRQADASQKKVGVLMLDGRKFKKINDQFGHDAGDAVIKEMAQRLASCVRPVDTPARLGGDELGVVFPELDSIELAEEAAKRILEAFETPLLFNGFEIPIGIGIGLAIYPDHADTEKQLIKCADMALYKAKESNRNEYLIYR
ncbi:PAS domain S-box protein [Planococcus sp. SSTMD024]|uniref:sensor domain-containing protein n=1 Tax=Planococcus sp. SSTMD024 TaxID=3242163 RepID=UPI00351E9EA3